MPVRMTLLGAPVIERDGTPVSFDTRKATAVLAYLAATERAHARTTLAAIGWPDIDRDRAGAALRRTLSTIRTTAGADVLVTDGDTVALDRDVVDVDLWEARQTAARVSDHGHAATIACARCVPALTTAAALYRGPFLDGFALRDSPEFEEWRFLTNEAVGHEQATVLTLLADAHVDAGDLTSALVVARRRLDLDMLHEPTHRLVMRLLAWNGDRAAALRQYRACVRALETDLGVRPLAETTELYEAIVADHLPATPGAGSDRASAVPAGDRPRAVLRATPVVGASGRRQARKLVPVAAHGADDRAPTSSRPTTAFVARDAEMAVLTAAVDGLGDAGAVVAVEGEAGIGKTRLLDELLASPAVTRRPLLRLACRQDEVGLALGTVMDALQAAEAGPRADWREALPSHVAREVGRVLPGPADLTGGTRPADGPGAAWRLRDALAAALATAVTVPGSPPGLVVVDDVHWIDESSLDVIAHLAHRLDRWPVGIVLSWRSELIDRGHRLRRLLADVAREGHVAHVSLTRLDAASVRRLLPEPTGGVADADALTDRVMASTEGVPLLVVEYLTALAVDPGALDGPPLRGADDLFRARLAAVSDAARQILTTAAVIGRSFDPDVARRVSGRSDEETVDALEELVTAGLVTELDGDPARYDFTHARLRTAAYDDIGLARRRLLHRRVAAELERSTATAHEAPAATIAAHHRAAGDDHLAATWLVRAAEHAASLLAVPDAVDLYDRALALGYPDPQPVHEAVGALLTLSGRYGDALRHLEAAAALAGDDRFAELEHRIAGVHIRRGQWVLAGQHLLAASAFLEDDPAALPLRARILTDRGLVAHRQGDDDEAAVLAADALAAAEATDDLGALAGAHNLLGVLSRHDLSKARHHLEHALALARRLHDVAVEVAAANNLAKAHAAAGATARALPIAQAALERSTQLGDRHRRAALHNNLADLLRAEGRDEEAMIQLKQAVTLFAEIDEDTDQQPEVWKLAEW